MGAANAARCLDAHIRAHNPAHQCHILGGGALAGEAGAGLDEIGARGLGDDAGLDLLLVSEQGRFDDDLDGEPVGRSYHARDILFHQPEILALERTDVDDHIEFGGALLPGAAGFVGLDIGQCGPQGETNDRGHHRFGACQQPGRQRHPGGIDAHRCETEFRRFRTQLPDLVLGGLRFEQGMVDVAGDIGGHVIHAQPGAEAAGAQRDHIPGHIGMMHDAMAVADLPANGAEMHIRLLGDD